MKWQNRLSFYFFLDRTCHTPYQFVCNRKPITKDGIIMFLNVNILMGIKHLYTSSSMEFNMFGEYFLTFV